MDQEMRRKKHRISVLESEMGNTGSLINELFAEMKKLEAELRMLQPSVFRCADRKIEQ